MAVGRAKATRAVGRYQLVHELGQSYLGPLWAVRVDGADGSAQLAMLRLVSLARLDADTRVRLLEAAWQAMEVRDDRVCPVTDVVASDGELGIVSDYVEGVTLRGLSSFASVRRKPAAPAIALRVALDLLAAVSALHRTTAELGEEAVPLYGGLSADSVLLAADGRTLVLDVAVTSAASTIETLGGNPERAAYAAPEQLRAPPTADARTDLFTVGVLFWELLSCRRLFVGSDKAVAQKVLSSKIPRPDELRRKGDPEMPAALVAAVMRALDRDPGARPESAEVFAALLMDSGVVPAERDEVALYVTTLAEGALQRARDAVRSPSSGTRSVLPRTAGKPTAPEPRPTAPAARPPLPTRVEKAPGPGVPEQRPAPGARPDVKPPLPTRVEVKSPEAARLDPKPVMRARQPTMIGIPAPAVQLARTVSVGDAEAQAAPPTGAAGPESSEPATRTAAREATEVDRSDEEPTAQFTSRDLLHQMEAMGRRNSEPSRNAPTEFPKPDATPAPPEEFPKPEATSVLSDLARLDAPSDGGWLDDPASLPPPPPVVDREAVTPDDPRETAPVDEARFPVARVPNVTLGSARGAVPTRPPEVTRPAPEPIPSRAPERPLTSRPGPLSVAPAPTTSLSIAPSATYLPSQVPPPLIHDPRARSTGSRRLPTPGEPESPRVSRGMAMGVAVSLGLVIASAAVAIVVLRGQREEDPEARESEAARSAAVPTRESQAPAEFPAEPAPTGDPAASASTELPIAAASESAEPAAPGALPPKPPVAAPRFAPQVPRRAPPPKKKGRYVPDDI